VEQALKIFLPLVSIKNNPHDVLRSLASATTPDLLNCATAAVAANSPMRTEVDRLSVVVIDNLVQAMLIESSEMDMDMETLKTQIQALKAAISASTCCAKVGGPSAPASPASQNGGAVQAPGTPPKPPSPSGAADKGKLDLCLCECHMFDLYLHLHVGMSVCIFTSMSVPMYL
jgi:hypothetical protein